MPATAIDEGVYVPIRADLSQFVNDLRVAEAQMRQAATRIESKAVIPLRSRAAIPTGHLPWTRRAITSDDFVNVGEPPMPAVSRAAGGGWRGIAGGGWRGIGRAARMGGMAAGMAGSEAGPLGSLVGMGLALGPQVAAVGALGVGMGVVAKSAVEAAKSGEKFTDALQRNYLLLMGSKDVWSNIAKLSETTRENVLKAHTNLQNVLRGMKEQAESGARGETPAMKTQRTAQEELKIAKEQLARWEQKQEEVWQRQAAGGETEEDRRWRRNVGEHVDLAREAVGKAEQNVAEAGKLVQQEDLERVVEARKTAEEKYLDALKAETVTRLEAGTADTYAKEQAAAAEIAEARERTKQALTSYSQALKSESKVVGVESKPISGAAVMGELAKTRDKWLREHPKAVAPVLSSAEQEQVRGSEADVAIAEQALTAQQERIAQFEKTMPKERQGQFFGAEALSHSLMAGALSNKPEVELAKQQLESLKTQEKQMQESVTELKTIAQTLKDKLGLG